MPSPQASLDSIASLANRDLAPSRRRGRAQVTPSARSASPVTGVPLPEFIDEADPEGSLPLTLEPWRLPLAPGLPRLPPAAGRIGVDAARSDEDEPSVSVSLGDLRFTRSSAEMAPPEESPQPQQRQRQWLEQQQQRQEQQHTPSLAPLPPRLISEEASTLSKELEAHMEGLRIARMFGGGYGHKVKPLPPIRGSASLPNLGAGFTVARVEATVPPPLAIQPQHALQPQISEATYESARGGGAGGASGGGGRVTFSEERYVNRSRAAASRTLSASSRKVYPLGLEVSGEGSDKRTASEIAQVRAEQAYAAMHEAERLMSSARLSAGQASRAQQPVARRALDARFDAAAEAERR